MNEQEIVYKMTKQEFEKILKKGAKIAAIVLGSIALGMFIFVKIKPKKEYIDSGGETSPKSNKNKTQEVSENMYNPNDPFSSIEEYYESIGVKHPINVTESEESIDEDVEETENIEENPTETETNSSSPENNITVISYDTWTELCDDEDWEVSGLTYYNEDDILTDEIGEVILDPEHIVGEALQHFGEESEDPDIVYIKNYFTHTIYEIVRLHKSYQASVLGYTIDQDEESKYYPKNKSKREE